METSSVPVEDRETLKLFLSQLRKLLDDLAHDPHGLFPPELRPLVAKAWDELVAEERFEDVSKAIDDREYERGMVAHGLQGAQLDFKVAVFGEFLEIARKHEEKRLLKRRRLRRWVPKALEAANVTIDSVAAFVPPAAAISEFKRAVEVGIAKRGAVKGVLARVNPFSKRRRRERELAEAP
ncbi:MAG TPA: hypothetical protein VFY69_07710 [Solirubrobacterales bacterium]|nr:hypothetical protein [Solirubrobacterales bacterium]